MTTPLGRALSRACGRLVLLAALASTAAAQNDTTMVEEQPLGRTGPQHTVSVLTGYQWFDEQSALTGAPLIGLRIERGLGSLFTAGVNLGLTRPSTRGEMFPWNRQVYFSNPAGERETTLVFITSQDVVMATYGAQAGARLPLSRTGWSRATGRLGAIALEALAGVGFTTIWADPEQNRTNRVLGGWYWNVGGGVSVPLPQNTALSVRVDDVVLRNHFPSRLSLADPLFADDLFDDPAKAPERKSSYHSPRVSVAFTFIPGAN
jgi:hypothetical protein